MTSIRSRPPGLPLWSAEHPRVWASTWMDLRSMIAVGRREAVGVGAGDGDHQVAAGRVFFAQHTLGDDPLLGAQTDDVRIAEDERARAHSAGHSQTPSPTTARPRAEPISTVLAVRSASPPSVLRPSSRSS
jgi:hypothetical protein